MTAPDSASGAARRARSHGNPGGRTLILLRHGKADYPGGTRDYDRPLADRGEAEASAAGRWIRSTQPHVDAVLCSASLRTRQTFAATGIVAPATFSDDVYEASTGDILRAVQQTGPDTRTLMVVGHAPGIPGLAMLLAGAESDQDALDEVSAKFPTSAMAVLIHAGDWASLGREQATLTAFHVAKVPHRDHH